MYSIFIFVVSTIPITTTVTHFGIDKIIHFFMYGALAVLTLYAFRESAYCYVKSFIYTLCWGVLIEFVQYSIPYRSFELKDILVNVLGSSAGLLSVYKIGTSYHTKRV